MIALRTPKYLSTQKSKDAQALFANNRFNHRLKRDLSELQQAAKQLNDEYVLKGQFKEH